MDYINDLPEDTFNKLQLLLCPICFKTVPSITPFIEPRTKTVNICIKCPNQDNIATIPLKDYLTEYILYELNTNKSLNTNVSVIDKYNLNESNAIKPNDMPFLKHRHQTIPKEHKNKCAACGVEDSEEQIAQFCAQCLRWFCMKCKQIHSKLAKDHILNWYGFDIKDKCEYISHNKQNDLVNIKKCSNCGFIICEKCCNDTTCLKCSNNTLKDYNEFRKELKKKFIWNKIVETYDDKIKQDEHYMNEFINKIKETIQKLKRIQTEVENVYEQHKLKNKEIFILLKLLYANFEKAKEYRNFTILNNINTNFIFNNNKFTPNEQTLQNIDLYKNELISFYENNNFIQTNYNNYLYKIRNSSIKNNNNVTDKHMKVISKLFIPTLNLLFCATSNNIIAFKWHSDSQLFIKNITLSSTIENICIIDMVIINKTNTIAFLNKDKQLGLLYITDEDSIPNFEIIKPIHIASKLQKCVMNKDMFLSVKHFECGTVFQLNEYNKLKEIRKVDNKNEKNIYLLCDLIQDYVIYTCYNMKVFIERISGGGIFQKLEQKEVHIPDNEGAQILHMVVIHNDDKLLLVRNNCNNGYLKIECVVVCGVSAFIKNGKVCSVITVVPWEIIEVFNVERFIFGKIRINNNNNGNIGDDCFYLVNLQFDDNTNCLKYSNLNIEGCKVIHIENQYMLVQNENDLCLFENVQVNQIYDNRSQIGHKPIALYNVDNKIN